MPTINENIAKNITLLRKQKKLTQQELAQKLNYSDKSVSKWERGDSIPDIEMLDRIAKIFNTDIDYLIKEHNEGDIKKLDDNSQFFIRNLLILIMVCVAVLLVATIAFVYPVIFNHDNAKKYWLIYLFTLPICSLICHFYARKMNIWLMKMISISAFIWTLITSLYMVGLILGNSSFWLLFLVGIPIQASICLFFFWRRTF